MTHGDQRLADELDEAKQWLEFHPGEGELPPDRLPSGETARPERTSRQRLLPYDTWEDGFEKFEETLAPTNFMRSKTVEQRRLAAQIEYVWQYLRPQDQELFTLRYYELMTLEEIAAEFGVSYQAVQSRLKTAHQNLKAAIAEHGTQTTEVNDNDL